MVRSSSLSCCRLSSSLGADASCFLQVLDHLIVQQMDKEEDVDVVSMITAGAKKLFNEDDSAAVVYSPQDVSPLQTIRDASHDLQNS